MTQKVLLVYPPNQLMSIETPRPDGSLGPLYLAAALERSGYETDILDASVGTLDDCLEDTFYRTMMQENGLIRIGMAEARIRETITRGGYSVVGINSNFTPQTRMALEVARAAKNVSPDILVIAGGVNARALPDRFLKSGLVDAVCLTEGERIIVHIVRAWEKNRDLSSVSGIVRMENGRMLRQPVLPTDVSVNLDELPVPAWEKLPIAHYECIASPHEVLPAKRERYRPVMTSRGCWAKCLYCHISYEKEHAAESGGIGALRFKSVERVMEELARLKELGTTKLYFEDDTLLVHKRRIVDIFRRVRSMGFTLADVNGVNLVHFQKRQGNKLVIDVEFLELLREAGFDHIELPVESGSQRILDKYATGKLNHSTLDVVELVQAMTKVEIECPINMMLGFPDETEEEIMTSFELGKRLVNEGARNCTPLIAIPFAGSMLYDYAIQHGHLESDFDTDTMNWKNCVMRNTVVPAKRIVELRDWGWKYMNHEGHMSARLAASAGVRWESGAPARS